VPRRFVDLSAALEQGIASDPPSMLPRIDYRSHRDTAAEMAGFFPGLTVDQLPGGEGWAVENVTISTHNGTHLDAPYHFQSTMNDGARAITIDEVPLDWCFAPGVKLDFRRFDDGYVASPEDVKAELDRIGHRLQPLDIVLVNTSAGGRYGEADYVAPRARGARHRNGCLELGCALPIHRSPLRRDARSGHHLGRPPRRHADRLLPHREACQSRGASVERLHGRLLSIQDQRRVGRLHPRRRHHRDGIT
jgi:kynurenine formamidase